MQKYLINNFQSQGFILHTQPLITGDLLDKAKDQITDITQALPNTETIPASIQRIGYIHAASEAFHHLITRSELGKMAAEILGAKQVKVWGSQLYIKPPNSAMAGHVGWHRDSQHLPHLQGDILVAWLALDEVTEATGSLQYVKGSHLPNSFTTPKGGDFQDIETEAQRLAASNPAHKWETVNATLPKGGVSFHHWDLIHGSGTNYTNQPRIGLSIGLASENFKVLDGLPDYGLKSIIDAPLYCPIIYDETTQNQPNYAHH